MRPGGHFPQPRRGWPDRDDRRSGWEAGDIDAGWPGTARARVCIPVVVSFLFQVPFAVARVIRPEVLDTARSIAVLGLAVALIGPLALIAARRWPGPVVAVVSAAASADLLLREPAFGPPYVALAFAIVAAVVRGARVWAWVSLAAGWAVTVIVGGLLDTSWRPQAVAGITFGILVVLGIGEAIRTRRDRFDQSRRSAIARRQTAVEAERVRIARELHDVLAHSLSQINVQAGVGLHLMDTQPQKAADALASIKESSKTALDEVRSVLGILRSGGADAAPASLVPEPDLSRLAALVDSVASSDLTVSLDIDRQLDPPAAVQFAVYRIVQEALTNVVRHSAARSVRVRVHGTSSSVSVSIADDGGSEAHPTPGRGLLGMRERAELLGGSLAIDAARSGFTIAATIPVGHPADSLDRVDSTDSTDTADSTEEAIG